jgi:hypothetical protein
VAGLGVMLGAIGARKFQHYRINVKISVCLR